MTNAYLMYRMWVRRKERLCLQDLRPCTVIYNFHELLSAYVDFWNERIFTLFHSALHAIFQGKLYLLPFVVGLLRMQTRSQIRWTTPKKTGHEQNPNSGLQCECSLKKHFSKSIFFYKCVLHVFDLCKYDLCHSFLPHAVSQHNCRSSCKKAEKVELWAEFSWSVFI